MNIFFKILVISQCIFIANGFRYDERFRDDEEDENVLYRDEDEDGFVSYSYDEYSGYRTMKRKKCGNVGDSFFGPLLERCAEGLFKNGGGCLIKNTTKLNRVLQKTEMRKVSCMKLKEEMENTFQVDTRDLENFLNYMKTRKVNKKTSQGKEKTSQGKKKTSTGNKETSTGNKETSQGLKEWQQACVDTHNLYRSKYGYGSLQWDSELAKHAQDYANTLAKKKIFKHSYAANKGTMGENLAWNKYELSDTEHVKYSIYKWYMEICDLKLDSCPFNLRQETGHLYAVLWKETTKVGCGISKRSGDNYIVANYYKPANRAAWNQFPCKAAMKEKKSMKSRKYKPGDLYSETC